MPDKQKDMQAWKEALRSGKYTQTQGTLCRREGYGNSYCCLGVLDEVVFKTDWKPIENSDAFEDQNGRVQNFAHQDVHYLGLDEYVTAEEAITLRGYAPSIYEDDSRLAALAQINDHGGDFDTIVMVIEQLGWDK